MGDYCKQHHPDTVKAKNEAWRKKYNAQWEAKKAAWELEAKITRRGKALPDFLAAARKAEKMIDGLLEGIAPSPQEVAEFRTAIAKAEAADNPVDQRGA